VFCSLILVTKGTKRGTSPFAPFQVISSQDSIPEKLPEEDFNFERNFCLPNPFVMRTSQISLEVLIHRFDRENFLIVQVPSNYIRIIRYEASPRIGFDKIPLH
jgi:hypothetical protein